MHNLKSHITGESAEGLCRPQFEESGDVLNEEVRSIFEPGKGFAPLVLSGDEPTVISKYKIYLIIQKRYRIPCTHQSASEMKLHKSYRNVHFSPFLSISPCNLYFSFP